MKNRKAKPVTGGKAGVKGQKAILTAKYAKHAKRRQHELDRQDACPTTQRRKLAGILERFDISVRSFNALRADSYEKHLAGRSLADLEAFYGVLLGSCRGYREMARECPTWGDDDKPPHCTTLCSIKQRIMAEQTVADLEDKLKQLDAVQARISGLPAETQARLLNGMVTYLSQDLLNAKFDGKPIMENLRVMDRLLKAGSLRVRERREARAEARLAWEQAGKPINPKAESGKRPMIGSKAETGEGQANVTGDNHKNQNKNNPQISQIDADSNDEGRKENSEARSQESETSETLDPDHEAEESATDDTESTGDNQNSNDECRMMNEAGEAVETDEECQQRRQEEYDRMWEKRKWRIREGSEQPA